MIIDASRVHELSDADLLAQLQLAAADERSATARVVALLMEVDTRRVYLGQGYSSLFAYCVHVLHLSEHEAYGRIEAARAARRFPLVLERLADGAITLTAIGLLAPHLTDDNHVEVLDAAKHKKKSNVELLAARLRSKPDVPSTIRKLLERKTTISVEADRIENPRPSVSLALGMDSGAAAAMDATAATLTKPSMEMKPLSAERYKIQFTVNRETYEKLRYAQDLLRHTIPNGDPAAIFERALTLLVGELEKTKLAAAKRPKDSAAIRTDSRRIPASVKRAVWRRDGGQCAFRGTLGRCPETGFLEFHHVVPFAAGGKTTVENLELRCRAHNAYEAEQYFGSRKPPMVRETRMSF